MIYPQEFLDRYDYIIDQAVEKFLKPYGGTRNLLKAQLLQESVLSTHRKSGAGAIGIGQTMPATWDELAKALGIPVNLVNATDAYYGIMAAAYYMQKCIKTWISPRPDTDRYNLALASYNAGGGNIIKAQKAAGNPLPNGYEDIMKFLPKITGKNSVETINYTKAIRFYEAQLNANGRIDTLYKPS